LWSSHCTYRHGTSGRTIHTYRPREICAVTTTRDVLDVATGGVPFEIDHVQSVVAVENGLRLKPFIGCSKYHDTRRGPRCNKSRVHLQERQNRAKPNNGVFHTLILTQPTCRVLPFGGVSAGDDERDGGVATRLFFARFVSV